MFFSDVAEFVQNNWTKPVVDCMKHTGNVKQGLLVSFNRKTEIIWPIKRKEFVNVSMFEFVSLTMS